MNERIFLENLLKDPSDNETRLVYSDWLDENGHKDKAEFVRLTVRVSKDLIDLNLTAENARHPHPEIRHHRWDRLRQLAADMDTNWLAVVSAPLVENCGKFDPKYQREMERWWRLSSSCHEEDTLEEYMSKRKRLRFEFICNKKWSEMSPTDDPKVRHCGECKENVYFCDTIIDARGRGSEGHCVAVDLGVIRRDYDLDGEHTFFGRPSKDTLEKEEQRRAPDPVSEKRLAVREA